jgi:hypothetical protein
LSLAARQCVVLTAGSLSDGFQMLISDMFKNVFARENTKQIRKSNGGVMLLASSSRLQNQSDGGSSVWAGS